MERLVHFESEGCRVYGILGTPDGERPKAGVVVVHGWSGCRMGPHQILVKLCRHLNAEGYATLRFDLRGRGESEGETAKANLDGMIADAAAAIEYMRNDNQLERVSIVGICSGGNVALGQGRSSGSPSPLWLGQPSHSKRTRASSPTCAGLGRSPSSTPRRPSVPQRGKSSLRGASISAS